MNASQHQMCPFYSSHRNAHIHNEKRQNVGAFDILNVAHTKKKPYWDSQHNRLKFSHVSKFVGKLSSTVFFFLAWKNDDRCEQIRFLLKCVRRTRHSVAAHTLRTSCCLSSNKQTALKSCRVSFARPLNLPSRWWREETSEDPSPKKPRHVAVSRHESPFFPAVVVPAERRAGRVCLLRQVATGDSQLAVPMERRCGPNKRRREEENQLNLHWPHPAGKTAGSDFIENKKKKLTIKKMRR